MILGDLHQQISLGYVYFRSEYDIHMPKITQSQCWNKPCLVTLVFCFFALVIEMDESHVQGCGHEILPHVFVVGVMGVSILT